MPNAMNLWSVHSNQSRAMGVLPPSQFFCIFLLAVFLAACGDSDGKRKGDSSEAQENITVPPANDPANKKERDDIKVPQPKFHPSDLNDEERRELEEQKEILRKLQEEKAREEQQRKTEGENNPPEKEPTATKPIAPTTKPSTTAPVQTSPSTVVKPFTPVTPPHQAPVQNSAPAPVSTPKVSQKTTLADAPKVDPITPKDIQAMASQQNQDNFDSEIILRPEKLTIAYISEKYTPGIMKTKSDRKMRLTLLYNDQPIRINDPRNQMLFDPDGSENDMTPPRIIEDALKEKLQEARDRKVWLILNPNVKDAEYWDELSRNTLRASWFPLDWSITKIRSYIKERDSNNFEDQYCWFSIRWTELEVKSLPEGYSFPENVNFELQSMTNADHAIKAKVHVDEDQVSKPLPLPEKKSIYNARSQQVPWDPNIIGYASDNETFRFSAEVANKVYVNEPMGSTIFSIKDIDQGTWHLNQLGSTNFDGRVIYYTERIIENDFVKARLFAVKNCIRNPKKKAEK